MTGSGRAEPLIPAGAQPSMEALPVTIHLTFIGGALRAGHFGGGRFAGRFEPSHRVRGLVVPFGYYDDWYSGYGYYDPSLSRLRSSPPIPPRLTPT